MLERHDPARGQVEQRRRYGIGRNAEAVREQVDNGRRLGLGREVESRRRRLRLRRPPVQGEGNERGDPR
jgi:hypothetical protein